MGRSAHGATVRRRPLLRAALILGLVGGVSVRDSALHDADAAPVSRAMVPTDGPAMAVVGGNDVAVWRGSDGGAWTAVGSAPAAGSAVSLGGGIVGAPDIAASPDGTAIMVALGTDGGAWSRRRASNGSWGPWQSIGGRFSQAPTITSWGNGRFDVFGAGTDAAIWHNWTGNGGGSWATWSSLGGGASAAPDSASIGAGSVTVAIRGGDGAVWLKSWTGAAWTDWGSIGGVIAGGPAIAATARGDGFTLAARTSDSAVYVQRLAGGRWTGWGRRDGALASEPEVSLLRGTITIAGVGSDGRFYSTPDGGSWSARTWGDPPVPTDPYGAVESLGFTAATTVSVSGWVIDPSDPNLPVTVDVLVDGVAAANAVAALPHSTGLHGFAVSAPAGAGARTVCVRARDIGAGDDVVIGCTNVAPPPAGSYTFIATQARGNPIRFNPCAPIPIVFNGAGGPAASLSELDAAVAQLRAATGLNIYIESYTDEVAAIGRPALNVTAYGLRWAPILVGFSDPTRTPALAGGVAGLGGAAAASGPDGRLFVSGSVILDGPQANTLPLGWGSGPTLAKLILHELSHVIGLGHVEDTNQVMNPSIPSRPGGFGAGDFAGLSYLGTSQPCLRVPAALLGAIASVGVDLGGPEIPTDVEWHYQAHVDHD